MAKKIKTFKGAKVEPIKPAEEIKFSEPKTPVKENPNKKRPYIVELPVKGYKVGELIMLTDHEYKSINEYVTKKI